METNTTNALQPENNENFIATQQKSKETPVRENEQNSNDSSSTNSNDDSQELRTLKIGGFDFNGYKITNIYVRSDDFILYEIETKDIVESIRIRVNEYTESGKIVWERYNQIRVASIEIKSYLYKALDKTSAKSQIAQILAHGICSDPEAAIQEFGDLKKAINKEYNDQFNNKFLLLLSAIIISIMMAVASLLFHYNENWFASDPHIRNLVFVCTAGSIGGFFSISIGSRKLVCEKDVGWFLYFRYGMERMLISVFAATILYIGLRSEFLMLSVKNSLSSYMMLAFVAGFSETFIPGLFTRLEQGKLKNT